MLGNNSAGIKTCRACFWIQWAVDARAASGLPKVRVPAEDIARHVDQHGYDLVRLLLPETSWDEPVVTRCRSCGRVSADRLSDIGWACSCRRNTRSEHPTAKPAGGGKRRELLVDSGAEALGWWDHDRNSEDVLGTVTLRARREASWVCPECALQFTEQVYLMVQNPDCPACREVASAAWKERWARLKVTSISEIPELAAAWADDADPRTVMVGDFGMRKFRCSAGHMPRISPSRFLDAGCPHCRGVRSQENKQWLADISPELAKQWHPTRNGRYTPANVVWDSKPGSVDRVGW
ncbi:zinc-ribbon domain-containing protein [Actinopolymorpha pittospori]|uniref:Zn-finger nucleic acid-binding protein n=1 Tax=Actinopolymorpha pittospori TaxID=648752 RepID=A0A927MT87_9ACTN|nr:hypothetical protein [Actinopolymorpha pittospori]MBE1604838.1 Zn-finger nucleic acid-binding protein [Actinopolymorpha pittospori]